MICGGVHALQVLSFMISYMGSCYRLYMLYKNAREGTGFTTVTVAIGRSNEIANCKNKMMIHIAILRIN